MIAIGALLLATHLWAGLRLATGMPAMVVGGRQLWPKRLRS